LSGDIAKIHPSVHDCFQRVDTVCCLPAGAYPIRTVVVYTRLSDRRRPVKYTIRPSVCSRSPPVHGAIRRRAPHPNSKHHDFCRKHPVEGAVYETEPVWELKTTSSPHYSSSCLQKHCAPAVLSLTSLIHSIRRYGYSEKSCACGCWPDLLRDVSICSPARHIPRLVLLERGNFVPHSISFTNHMGYYRVSAVLEPSAPSTAASSEFVPDQSHFEPIQEPL